MLHNAFCCFLLPVFKQKREIEYTTNRVFEKSADQVRSSASIFIIGENDLSKLPEFLYSPIEPLPSEVVDSYDVNNWIESFQ